MCFELNCYFPFGYNTYLFFCIYCTISELLRIFIVFSILQEVEINKKRPSFIKSKERVSHIQKKLNSAKKSLEEIRRVDDAHRIVIEKLEEELTIVERQRSEYEELVAGESQLQGRNVQLEDAQVSVLKFSS